MCRLNKERSCRKALKNGKLKKKTQRRIIMIAVIFGVFIVLSVLFVFVVIPVIFMFSIELQRQLIFTRFNLPCDEEYFNNYNMSGYRNLYLSLDHGTETVSLGLWHLLPSNMINESINDAHFSYEHALKNSSYSVLMYFHGTGETRADSVNKYQFLRIHFHIITFDYRSYGDSTNAELTEDSVVNDCVQVYEWLRKKTPSPIFVWGHSLGSALAARTLVHLKSLNIQQPLGLVLEGAFTKMSDEIYVHPYGKIFAWLPWFRATVVEPLSRNGFIFDTEQHIADIDIPIMILCAEDDDIVPYEFGRKLHNIAKNRSAESIVMYYQFPYSFGHKHYWIYLDRRLPIFIEYFIYISKEFSLINNYRMY